LDFSFKKSSTFSINLLYLQAANRHFDVVHLGTQEPKVWDDTFYYIHIVLMLLKEQFLKLKETTISENITTFVLCFLAMFPILPPALQSISLGVFCVLIIILNHNNFNRYIKDKKRNLSFIALISFYIFSLFSYFWSDNNIIFFKEVQPNLSLLTFAIVFTYFFNIKKTQIELFMYVFICVITIFVFNWYSHFVEGYGYYQKLMWNSNVFIEMSNYDKLRYFFLEFLKCKKGLSEFSRIGHYFMKTDYFFNHYTYTSALVILAIYFSYNLIKRISNWILKIIFSFMIIFFSLFVIYNDSIISKFFLLVLSFFLVIKLIVSNLNINKKTILVFLFNFFLIGIFLIIKSNILSKISLIQVDSIDNTKFYIIDYTRYIIYKSSLCSIKNNLLFGIGISEYKNKINDYFPNILVFTKINLNKNTIIDTHSQFLYYFIGNGFIGLILFLIQFTFLLFKCIKKRSVELSLFLFFIILNCSFENFLCRIYGVYIYIIVVYFLFNYYGLNSDRNVVKK
jgi:hypothetical protein